MPATSTVINGGAGATSPFSIGVPQSSGGGVTTTTTSTIATTGSSTTSASGSFSTLDVVIIVVIVLALIVSVIVYVGRDSRRTAKALGVAGSRPGTGGQPNHGSKAAPRGRKQMSSAEKKRRKRGRAPRRR